MYVIRFNVGQISTLFITSVFFKKYIKYIPLYIVCHKFGVVDHFVGKN